MTFEGIRFFDRLNHEEIKRVGQKVFEKCLSTHDWSFYSKQIKPVTLRQINSYLYLDSSG